MRTESESTYIFFQAQLLNMCYSGLVLITDKTVENAFCCEFELKCLWGLFYSVLTENSTILKGHIAQEALSFRL